MKTSLRSSENRGHNPSVLTEGNCPGHVCKDDAVGELELADILDCESLQLMMEDFNRLTGLLLSIGDRHGNALVAVGWQDICTKFHRIHPETRTHCTESDLQLCSRLNPGEYKLYRCKNNLWDAATPIIVDGLHLGNLYYGQFFFDDEDIPYDTFRQQARKYGFNEEEYMEALEKVPRLSREKFDAVMSFYTRLTYLISNLSYSNIKLARTLDERDNLLTSLHESESQFRSYVEQAPDGVFITDEKGNYVEVNEAASRITGYSRKELLEMNLEDITFPDDMENALLHFQNVVETGKAVGDFHFLKRDGEKIICTVKAVKLSEKRFLGFVQDVTQRKHVEDERKITIRLLNLLNASNDVHELIDSVTELLQDCSGCEAVGIRLKKDDDYPYYQARGFPENFVVLENSLCSTDSNGNILRDELGNPFLDCMCGSVISGRFDSENPYFTSHGSFWTNSTSELLAKAGESEGQIHTRNRCNDEGYESVALIPLRSQGGTLGLIQLNDSRKGMFTAEHIALLERLSDSIAMALAQRRAQEAAISNKEKLQSIFRVAPAGIGVVKNRVFTDVNTRMCEMTGYNADELLGFSSRKLYLTQEDFEYVGKEKYRQIVEKGTGTIETQWKRKDGAIIDVLLSSTPRDSSDFSKGVTFTALDISKKKHAEEALKHSERMFKSLFEQAATGVAQVALDGHFLRVNERFSEIIGYPVDELVEMNFRDITHPDDLPLDEKYIRQTIAGNIDSYEIEKRYIHKKGHSVWAKLYVRIVCDEDSRGLYAISVIADITEKRKAEEALIYAKDIADESNRIKSEMLKNVTHELRTPLTSVIGFSDLLLNGDGKKLNESQRSYVDCIHQSGQDLLSIVNKMLDYANVEYRTSDSLELQPVNVKDVIYETLNILSLKASKKNIKIDINIDQNLDLIMADKRKLANILYNLVENAIKFTGHEGYIKVEAKIENDYVLFSVYDTGIGIAKEKLAGIFEPFRQVDGSISRKYGGTGLGLSLVKKLVEMHDGHIWIESEPGKGSNFLFEIPAIPVTCDIRC
ncbi:PAS domain S-box protein [Methanolobus sp. ZRKC2]|uniref:PAS domain S-box protein n=1 Tax=Methanolobus sp. ZRKC2 TaxID=3125783 RepID=UPI003247C793